MPVDIGEPGEVEATTNWVVPPAADLALSNDVAAVHEGGDQDWLILKNLGISLTSPTVDGIEVLVEGSGKCNTERAIVVRLTKDGSTPVGDAKNITLPLNTDSQQTVGGAADLWGTTWSEAEVESANFGVMIQASTATAVRQRRIDYCKVSVTNS